MENEKELEAEETLKEPEEILDESGIDTTDWKAEALKNYGRAKRYQTDLKKIKESETKAKAEEDKAPKSQDKKDFDYAEKSYLLSNGIKKSEIPLFWEESQKTGKDIDFLLEAKYFQNELNEKREFAASQEALPSGSKRSGGMARDVDYYVKKGEMPADTPENQKLRREIVNSQIKAEKIKSQFTNNSIV